jgi:hypothetical protein
MSMQVWCPLIPPDEYPKLNGYENELDKVSNAYDDWQAFMRGKPFIETDVGVMLDRIRMLMMGIGVACAQDRDFAEIVQSILSENLRRTAIELIDRLSDTGQFDGQMVGILTNFFSRIKFTRDLYPREEIEKAIADYKEEEGGMTLLSSLKRAAAEARSDGKSADGGNETVIQAALSEAASVTKRIYLRLLSPDPWGIQ